MRNLLITFLFFFVTPFSVATAQPIPPVEEVIRSAIAKRESDRSHCDKYVNAATKSEIKYDKKLQVDEQKTTRMFVYHWGERRTAEILSMEKDGKPLEKKEVDKRIRELNKEWEEEQKRKEKREEGSRDNFVDPLTLEGMADYRFTLVERRDTSFAVVEAAVAQSNHDREPTIIDQTVERLRSYYIVTATSLIQDQRHIEATYWIDADTYGILRQEFSPSKLPRFVDLLDFQIDFQLVEDGDAALYLPRRFELMGKAGLLFFKGRFGVIEEFSEYRCDPTIPDSLFDQRYFYSGAQEGTQ